MDDQIQTDRGVSRYRIDRDGKVQTCWSRTFPKLLTDTWLPLRPVGGAPDRQPGRRAEGPRDASTASVLKAFVGPRRKGWSAATTTGDPANNRGDEPAVGQLRGNEHDKVRHGTRPMGSRSNAKLSEEEVLEIRSLQCQGVRFADLARRFGVCPQNIEAIVYRRSWRHLP